jgi:glycosyltransferase involved in cell wall biosynthesis
MSPLKLRSALGGFVELARACREIASANVLYSFVNTLRGSAFLLLAKWGMGKRCVAYCGTDRSALLLSQKAGKLRSRVLLRLEQLAMRAADARIVTGPKLLEQYGFLENTWMAAPVSPLLRRAPTARAGSRTEPHLKLLCVSHLRPQKGVEIVLAACGLLKQRGMSFRLDLVGDGECRVALESYARSLGLEGEVRFHGYVRDHERLARYYEDNDIFLFASTVEGFPRAIWEAVHFGVYVICVDVAGVKSLFPPSQMAVLPSADPDLMADAISSIAAEPDRMAESTDAARRTLGQLFRGDPAEQFEMCLRAIGVL